MSSNNTLARLIVEIVLSTRRAEIELRNWQRSVSASASNMERLAGTLGRIGGAASVFLLVVRYIQAVDEILQQSLQSFAALEKQIIDIQKISGGLFNDVSNAFFRVVQANPGATFNESSAAMAAAARTGLTLENGLEKLTEVGIRLAQVAGDLTPTEAVEGLSTLMQNLNLSVDQVDNLASAIDTLSDKFKATTGQIVKSSARLAGFAQTTKTSGEDLAAISTVLLASGQQPTVVNSSIVRLLVALKANLFDVTNALNITGKAQEDFFVKFNSGQTVEGIIQFIEALDKLSFAEQTALLEELGISGARVRPVIEILKSKTDDLRRAQREANQASAEGTSLLKKQGLAVDSAAARIQILKNETERFNAAIANSSDVINLNIARVRIWQDTIEGAKWWMDQFAEAIGGKGARFTATNPGWEAFLKSIPGKLSNDLEKARALQVEITELMKELQRAEQNNMFNYFTRIYIERLQRFADLNQRIIEGIKEAEKLGLDPQTGRTAAELADAAAQAGKMFGEELTNALNKSLRDNLQQLTSILGEPGRLITLAQRLIDLSNTAVLKQNPGLAALFGPLANAILDDAVAGKESKKQDTLQEFKQIWEKAIFGQDKNGKNENIKLLRLQVDFAKQLINLMKDNNNVGIDIRERLDKLLENAGGVIQ